MYGSRTPPSFNRTSPTSSYRSPFSLSTPSFSQGSHDLFVNEESEPNESRTSLTPEENRRDIFSQEEMEERLTPEEKTREFAEEAEFPTHLEFSLVERVSPLMAPEVAYVWYVTVDGIAGAVLARLAYQVPDSELVVIIARDPTNRLLPVFSLPYTSALIEPIQETEDEIHFLANDVYNPLRDDIDLSFR